MKEIKQKFKAKPLDAKEMVNKRALKNQPKTGKITEKNSGKNSRKSEKVKKLLNPKTNILVVQGPNLNLLGKRKPDIYGPLTLKEIHQKMIEFGNQNSIQFRFFQSNSEGAIIDCLHRNRKWAKGILINPGAYTHYSYAIRDAIEAIEIPTFEVHLSDIKHREPFRSNSVILPVCMGQIHGLGWVSYIKAVEDLLSIISNLSKERSGGAVYGR